MDRMTTRNRGAYTPKPRPTRSFTARAARGVLSFSPVPDLGIATALGMPVVQSEGEGDDLGEQVAIDRKTHLEAAAALSAMRDVNKDDTDPKKASTRSMPKTNKSMRKPTGDERFVDDDSDGEDPDGHHVPDGASAVEYLRSSAADRDIRASARKARPGAEDYLKAADEFEHTRERMQAGASHSADSAEYDSTTSSAIWAKKPTRSEASEYLTKNGAAWLGRMIDEMGIEMLKDLAQVEMTDLLAELAAREPPVAIAESSIKFKVVERILNELRESLLKNNDTEKELEGESDTTMSKKAMKKARKKARVQEMAARSGVFETGTKKASKSSKTKGVGAAPEDSDVDEELEMPKPSGEKSTKDDKELESSDNSDSSTSTAEDLFPKYLADCDFVKTILARLPAELITTRADVNKIVRSLFVTASGEQAPTSMTTTADLLETRINAFESKGIMWRPVTPEDGRNLRTVKLTLFAACADFARASSTPCPSDGTQSATRGQPPDLSARELSARLADATKEAGFKAPTSAAGRVALSRVQAVAQDRPAFELLATLAGACPKDGEDAQPADSLQGLYGKAMLDTKVACLLKSVKIPEPNSTQLLTSAPGMGLWEGGTVEQRMVFAARAANDVAASMQLVIEMGLDGLCVGDGAKTLAAAAYYGTFVTEGSSTVSFKFDELLDKRQVALTKSKGDKARSIMELTTHPMVIAMQDAHPNDLTIRTVFAQAQIASAGSETGKGEMHNIVFGALFTSLSRLWDRFQTMAQPLPTLAKAWEQAKKDYPSVTDALSPAAHKVSVLESKFDALIKENADLKKDIADVKKQRNTAPPATKGSGADKPPLASERPNLLTGKARQEMRDKLKEARDKLLAAEKAAEKAASEAGSSGSAEVTSLQAAASKKKRDVADLQAKLDAKA